MLIFTRTINTNPEEAHALREEALQFFMKKQSEGMATHVDEYFFRLALDETLANAMHHGNRNEESRKIEIIIEINMTGVVVSVKDEGQGFNPAELPDPRSRECVFKNHGRGIFI